MSILTTDRRIPSVRSSLWSEAKRPDQEGVRAYVEWYNVRHRASAVLSGGELADQRGVLLSCFDTAGFLT
jgi:hypothetical protein